MRSSTFRGPGYDHDEVTYYYDDECISFTWIDEGVNPTVEHGLRGINVSCDKWQTSSGLHVGSSLSDVTNSLSRYCPHERKNGALLVESKDGIWFEAPNRNEPVSEISVIPDGFWDCED